MTEVVVSRLQSIVLILDDDEIADALEIAESLPESAWETEDRWVEEI